MPYTNTQTYSLRSRTLPELRGRLNDPTIYEGDSLYSKARHIINTELRSVSRKGGALKRSERAVARMRQHPTHRSEYLLAQLILQSPTAAEAQRQMDRHRGGYKNRRARLFELIDFNDTFVDTALSLDRMQLKTFTVRLRAEIDWYCTQVGVQSFDDKQFAAIVHGLSREIAVYRAATELGYRAKMTSRLQDSKGIDMIITDPETKKSISIDVKTHSSFHFRLLKLQQSNRLTEEQRLQCELAGYCTIRYGKGYNEIDTVLLRIATDRLGEIHHYEFVDNEPFGELLADAFKHHGRYVL